MWLKKLDKQKSTTMFDLITVVYTHIYVYIYTHKLYVSSAGVTWGQDALATLESQTLPCQPCNRSSGQRRQQKFKTRLAHMLAMAPSYVRFLHSLILHTARIRRPRHPRQRLCRRTITVSLLWGQVLEILTERS